MLSAKLKKRLNRNVNGLSSMGSIKDRLDVKKDACDVFTLAAKEYAVKSCMDNIASLQYGLDHKLISGKPYKMSELYEQAIYAERAFTAGVRWALQYMDNRKRKI
jgi:hypothetical protein